MEYELETNNIKEKLIKWKNKAFELKEQYFEYQKKIEDLNKAPKLIKALISCYPVLFFITVLLLSGTLVIDLHLAIHPIAWILNTLCVIGIASYMIYEAETLKTRNKLTQWYLKKKNIEYKKKPFKAHLTRIEKEIRDLLCHEKLIQILKEFKPELDEKESDVFYTHYFNMNKSIKDNNLFKACDSLDLTLNYLIEHDHLFENKNKLIKYL